MPIDNSLLRRIPKTDELLELAAFKSMEAEYPHILIVEQLRAVLDGLRRQILNGERNDVPNSETVAALTAENIRLAAKRSLRRVINGTGVVLHTNLGRAKLCAEAVKAVKEVAESYSDLEYNLETGKRGSRYEHVEKILCRLTGAESALIVNNNAAAVLLILTSLTRGKEVVISRGELVEIGGSFRVPEIMEQSGSLLREVGTTNKTHLHDYADAIDPEKTGALLKVHTSNYRIIGFTEEVPLAELVGLGHKNNIPVIYDVGSGALIDFAAYRLPDEPNVIKCVKSGADIISFSGDKLLGGPQSGIIIGKRIFIEKMKRHPLLRAFRVDKMTLAALEATLRVYTDEEKAVKEIPTLQMLLADGTELLEKAETLCALLKAELPMIETRVVRANGQVGGGSMPEQLLPGYAAEITCPAECPPDKLAEKLRACEPPVIGRIAHNCFILDVRTMERTDIAAAADAVCLCLNEYARGETL